jgi:hypothetical protein|nr:MAG TPA: hypothetical protein [Caudoviricetes sp.]
MKLFKKLKTLFVPREQEITYMFNVSSRNVHRYNLANETVNITLREVRVFNVAYPRLTSRDVLLTINDLVGIVEGATLDTSILHILDSISKQSEETLKLNSEINTVMDTVFKDNQTKTLSLTIIGKGSKIKDLKSKTGLEVIKYILSNKLDCVFKEI